MPRNSKVSGIYSACGGIDCSIILELYTTGIDFLVESLETNREVSKPVCINSYKNIYFDLIR